MKRSKTRSWLAAVTALVLLISCMVSGLALPVAADATPTKLTLANQVLWIMTGRTRSMGTSTVTYSDSTTASVAASGITWSIADTTVATIDTNGKITPVAVGETTVTATLNDAVNADGNAVTATCSLHIVDGSKYVYAEEVPYTTGAEQIFNGDFEQGGTNWTSSNVVAGVGKDDSYGLQLSTATTQYYKKAFTVKPNTTYIFSYDYLSGKSTFYTEAKNLGIERKYHGGGSSSTRAWYTHTQIFTTPTNLKLNSGWDLAIKASSVVSGYPVIIDNVSICEYNSAIAVESLSLSYDELTMYPGQSWSLSAHAYPYGGNLNGTVWASSNTDVVTVNQGGGVQAVGPGAAYVTATTSNGVQAVCTVTVPGESLIKNGTFDGVDSSVWTADAGYTLQFPDTDTGKAHSGAVLKLERDHPVAQTIVGLQPNTTYTIKGSAKLPAGANYLGIAIVSGDTVLFSQTSDKYASDWDAADPQGTVTFASGYTFTTPSELTSDSATVIFSLLAEGETPATTVATQNSTQTSTEYAYLDDLWLFATEDTTEDGAVDLTITELSWTGDDGNFKGQVNPGTPITFSATVKNIGTDAIPAGKPFTVDFAAGGEVIRTVTYYGGVPAGGEAVLMATAWPAVAGDHMISARVNAAWDIMETNMTTNNTYQLNLRVATDRVAPTYTTVANAVQQAGMDRLTMSDDFDSLQTVDTLASGKEGYKWYVTRSWGETTLTTNDYRVDTDDTNNGILTLMTEKTAYNISLSTVDVNTLNGYRYNQGYMEARFRIVRPSENTSSENGIPAIWSFTENKALEAVRGTATDWVELDWMEYWGITKQYPRGYYTSTFHDSTTTSEPYYSNSNHAANGLGDAEWHVMGWLWENNSIRVFVDGVEILTQLYHPEAAAVPSVVPKQGGSATDTGVYTFANDAAAVLYLGASKDNPMEVDYVRIWQASEPTAVSDNMTMSESAVTLSAHEQTQLSVTVPESEDAGTLTWTSSNLAVATVHGNGVVYARGSGTATITATNANGTAVSCTVTVDKNLISGGDFEWENDLLHKHWQGHITQSSAINVVEDPADAANHCLQINANRPTSDARYYYALSVQKGKTYRLTGKFKGVSTLDMYFSGTYSASVRDLNNASGTTSTGWKYLRGTDTDGDGWKEFAVEFTTREAPSSWNIHYIFGFGNGESTACYLDDVSMYENVISGGDFEWVDGVQYTSWQYHITSSSAINVVEDPADATNHCLQIGANRPTSDARYYYNAPVQKGRTYVLTGKFKGVSTLDMYFSGTYCASARDLNNASGTTSTAWKYLQGTDSDGDGWKEFAVEFTTREAPSSWNIHYIFGFGNGESTECYLDDVEMFGADSAQ